MNVRSPVGYAIMLAYIIGNALTYNHVVKVGRAAITEPGDASYLVIKSLFISTIWPLYWLYRAFTG